MSFKRVTWLLLVVLLVGLLAACTATPAAPAEQPAVEEPATESQVEAEPVAQSPKYTFHHLLWGMTDPNVKWHIANAEAYMAMNPEVEIEYSGPENYVPAEHAQFLDTILASEPDGVLMHISDVDALMPALQKAQEMGVPVVSVTSHPPSEEANEKLRGLVLPSWVGSDEALVGGTMGEYLLSEVNPEPKHVVYLILTPGHAGHEARAAGFFDAMPEGTKTTKLATGEDPEQFKDILRSFLTQNDDVDVIFGMLLANKWVADVLDDVGKKDDIVYFTSDEAPSSLEGILKGYVTATFSQEFPIQGQLAYHILYLYKEYGMAPVEPIITGPSIVDASNVDTYKELAINALGEDGYYDSSPFER